MKKLSITALILGFFLILFGAFGTELLFTKKMDTYLWTRIAGYTEFSLLFLGGVTTFYGLIGWLFNVNLSKWCSVKTVFIALAIALTVGMGLHSGISMLSCYMDSAPASHPIRYPASMCLGLVCFAGFITLLFVYFKVRMKAKSVPGTVLDVLLGLSYCVPFFFVCVTADNILSAII